MSIRARPADAGDRVFVVSSWLDSYRTSYSAGIIAMNQWHSVMWPQVEQILDRPRVRTLVAYDTKQKDRIADLDGFITYDMSGPDPFVFYVYVKSLYRREGRAAMLFEAAGINPRARFDYACKTSILTRLAAKMPQARWDPLRARDLQLQRLPKEHT